MPAEGSQLHVIELLCNRVASGAVLGGANAAQLEKNALRLVGGLMASPREPCRRLDKQRTQQELHR